jgi:hypothetical protein
MYKLYDEAYTERVMMILPQLSCKRRLASSSFAILLSRLLGNDNSELWKAPLQIKI